MFLDALIMCLLKLSQEIKALLPSLLFTSLMYLLNMFVYVCVWVCSCFTYRLRTWVKEFQVLRCQL